MKEIQASAESKTVHLVSVALMFLSSACGAAARGAPEASNDSKNEQSPQPASPQQAAAPKPDPNAEVEPHSRENTASTARRSAHPPSFCNRLHSLDWRAYSLDLRGLEAAQEYVAHFENRQIEGFEQLQAASAAWHQVIVHEDLGCSSSANLVKDLIRFEESLAQAPARARGDDFYVQDMARYYQAFDTQTLLCDAERARKLWLALLDHPVGSWTGAAGSSRPGPANPQSYLDSARIAAALNYRDLEPKNHEKSQNLLAGVIASEQASDRWTPAQQAAACYLAEIKVSEGEGSSARALFSRLRSHVTSSQLVQVLDERIAAIDE